MKCRYYLLASAMLVACAAPVEAQTIGGFVVPPDLRTQPGGGYVGLTPIYKTDGTVNTPLDPTVTPPAQTGLTNIPIPSETGRVDTTANQDETSTQAFCKTIYYGGTNAGCDENKFRTIVDATICSPDDPIRNWGAPGRSHPHCFFGAGAINASSTYNSLRKHAIASAAAGTDANGTGYWLPLMEDINPFGNGINYGINLNEVVVYYSNTDNKPKGDVPPALRYVFGFEMDASSPTTQYAWLQATLNAMNAAQGYTRYSINASGTGGGPASAVYYGCTGATPATAPYIVNPDGSDPFNGTCDYAAFTGSASGTTLTVSAISSGTLRPGSTIYGAGIAGGLNNVILSQLSGTTNGVGTYSLSISQPTISSEAMTGQQDFFAEITGSACWNGKDLWSPGGYKHFIPKIWDTVVSNWVCPINYYRMPELTVQPHWTQYGWADRQRWVFSSDLAYRASHGLTSAQVPAGMTFHTDWLDGWDHNIMSQWEHNCVGTMGNIGHQCNSSFIAINKQLTGGGAGPGVGGRNPQVDPTWLPHGTVGDAGWFPIPSSWTGNMDMTIKK